MRHTEYNLMQFKMITQLFYTTMRIKLGFYILIHLLNVMLKKDSRVGNIATASSLLFSLGA